MSDEPQQPAVPTTPPSSDKKTKERSPAYPAIGLRKAVDYAKVLWDHDKRQSMLGQRAAVNLGFTAKSSGGMLALAAMKKFGLLIEEDSGEARKVRLSDSAIGLLNPSAANRDHLLKDAALKPIIYAELWNKYGADGASDGTIRDYLVFERKFFDDAVKILIAGYKDTIEFAKLREPDKISDESEPPHIVPAAPSNPAKDILNAEKPVPRTGREIAGAAFDFPPTSPNPPIAAGLIEIPVPLPSGQIAYYRVPSTMGELDFNFYQMLLNAYRPGIVKTARAYPCEAVWKNKDGDKPVTIISTMGAANGITYYMSSDKTGIPETELEFQ